MTLIIIALLINLALTVTNLIILVAMINGNRELQHAISAAGRIISRPVVHVNRRHRTEAEISTALEEAKTKP